MRKDDEELGELLRQYASGNESVRERLLEVIQPDLSRLAHEILTKGGSRGLVQTTVVVDDVIHRLFGRGKPLPPACDQAFRRLLLCVTRRVVYDHIRQSRAGKRDDHRVLNDSSLLEAQCANGRDHRLVDILDSFESIEKDYPLEVMVFGSWYLLGLTFREIGESLEISETTARSAVKFVKGLLRVKLEQKP